jgi:hypothetical protein
VDTGVYWFASGIVGIAGCLSAILLLGHSGHSIISSALIALIFAGGLFLIARPKSRLSPIVSALGDRCPRWLEKGKQIELAIRHFESQYPSSIRRMFLLDVACQVLLGAEVAAIFWCLKIPFHAGTLLGVEGASRAVKIMAGWMPARIGADESGSCAFLSAVFRRDQGSPAPAGATSGAPGTELALLRWIPESVAGPDSQQQLFKQGRTCKLY